MADIKLKQSLDPGAAMRLISPAYILTVLGLAQFINTYDTTAMNVAISSIVKDLHTTVTGVQLALTLYALTMAAFMIAGGKLCDVWGRKKVFALGISLYGLGALTTSLAPNLTVMIIGWSILEGLGSACMIPAIYAIIPVAFKDPKERVKAFAVIGSIAGAGAASGPLICGFITTYLTWRVSFAAEVVVCLLVLILQFRIKPPQRFEERPKFDFVGGTLSVIGLGLFVLGILQGNSVATRGWIPVVTLMGAGLVVLALFVFWQFHRERVGKAQLLDPLLLKVKQVRIGLPLTAVQTFMMAGSLFIIPVFQQMALNFTPMMTGLTFLPNTLAMVTVSQVSGRLSVRLGRKWLIAAGLFCMSFGIATVAFLIDAHSSAWAFLPGTLLMGTGLGIVMAPLLDLVQSSVPVDKSSEISGLNRAVFNLGNSLGTAVAGAVLIAVLITGVSGLVQKSNVLTETQKEKVTRVVRRSAETVSDSQMKELLEQRDVSAPAAAAIVKINSAARERSLRTALAVVAGTGFTCSFLVFLLPADRPRKKDKEDPPEF
ncbi:MAG: MFS transporter [Candidatus Geothermincolia bacterium]